MKDNFVLFPHFTRSDAIKQYSGPTIDTHTHTHTQTHFTGGNQSGCEPENSEKIMLLVKSILDF